MLDRSWTSAQLASVLCDALIKKGHLKEKPAFIRTDREKKIVDYFEACGLDGEKMESFDNPGPLEMMVRKGTNGEAWVQQVIDTLVEMLPESAGKATKKMGMDDSTKAELEEAKAKTEQRRERQNNDEGGEGGRGGGGRGERGEGGKGDNRNPQRERPDRGGWDDAAGGGGGNRGGGNRGGGDREERGGWGDSGGDRGGGRGGYNANGGDREERGGWGDSGGGKRGGGKGGGTENMQCYNCDNMGHSSRDCPEPRKETGKGKGKRYDRKAMVCDNCGQTGHKSRDCNEPVDEDKVRARLAAKAEQGA